MALYDLFKKDKPKKKAAKKKDKLAALDERISRGYRKPVASGKSSPGTSPKTTKTRASSTSPAPKPRTTKVRASSTSPAPKPRTTKSSRGPILRASKKAAPKKSPAKKAAAKKTSFKQAFADARNKQGAGGVFTWKKSEGGDGKKYTTDRADDKKKSPGSSAYNKKVRAKGPTQRIQSRMRRTRGGK